MLRFIDLPTVEHVIATSDNLRKIIRKRTSRIVFAAEALFQFSQHFSLANFFELVMHGDCRIPTYWELRGKEAVQRGKQKSLSSGIATMIADTALTRTHRTPFHNSGPTDAQYCVG